MAWQNLIFSWLNSYFLGGKKIMVKLIPIGKTFTF
jgi:hypothetical protein